MLALCMMRCGCSPKACRTCSSLIQLPLTHSEMRKLPGRVPASVCLVFCFAATGLVVDSDLSCWLVCSLQHINYKLYLVVPHILLLL